MKLPDSKKLNARELSDKNLNNLVPQDSMLSRIEEVLKKHNLQFGHLN